MCGIAGVLSGSGASAIPTSLLRSMERALHHRGPDDSGRWSDPDAGVGLIHTRLSILDLSAEGHQPMVSRSGRYVMVFNGEIYNFQTLREQLAGPWRGHSDTEVLLQAIDTWGLRRTVDACLGMFAFALWDREKRTLALVLDRLGVKPLFVARSTHGLLFGSELKALRACSDFTPAINRDAITSLLRYGYIPGPHTIYRNTWKVRPGTILSIRAETACAPERWETHRYWKSSEIAAAGLADPYTASPREAADHLEALLRDAVRLRMISDVPLGAFLSGGIDSSLVVALMQAQSRRAVKTFSIGFREAAFDEAPHARAVAKHLGTDHTELYVTETEAREVIPALPRLFDEPFADPSQIPTHLVSALARQQVTVALSGDGGDELFCGYSRYLLLRKLWQRTRWLPAPLRAPLGRALKSVPEPAWNRLIRTAASAAPKLVPRWARGHHVHHLADYLELRDPGAVYRRLSSAIADPATLVLGAGEPATYAELESAASRWRDPAEMAMQWDLITYLPDDILVKVDRASMAVGLEARSPFLDHRVVAFAWRTPLPLKVKDATGKWLLREVLYRHVPRNLIDRPKMGFGVPIGHWLRGPLREWTEDLLAEPRLRGEGFFDPKGVRQHWHDHLSGKRDADFVLWSILMFQSWLAENRAVAPPEAVVA